VPARARAELVEADAEQVLRELARARDRSRSSIRSAIASPAPFTSAAERLGEARSELATAESERIRLEEERARAVNSFERLRRHGFLSLVGLLDERSRDTGPATMTAGVEDARRLARLLQDEDPSARPGTTPATQWTSDSGAPGGDRGAGLAAVGGQRRRPVRRADHPQEIDHDAVRLQQIIAQEIETRHTYLEDTNGGCSPRSCSAASANTSGNAAWRRGSSSTG